MWQRQEVCHLTIATYIARYERFGPMIQQEMDLEEYRNIIQNFIYDDVSKEDNMTVIEGSVGIITKNIYISTQ